MAGDRESPMVMVHTHYRFTPYPDRERPIPAASDDVVVAIGVTGRERFRLAKGSR